MTRMSQLWFRNGIDPATGGGDQESGQNGGQDVGVKAPGGGRSKKPGDVALLLLVQRSDLGLDLGGIAVQNGGGRQLDEKDPGGNEQLFVLGILS